MFLSPIKGSTVQRMLGPMNISSLAALFSARRCSLFSGGLATLDLSDLKINERC